LLLREEAGLGLKEAHETMLRVLDEQPVTLEVSDELAERLLAQAQALGVKCCLEPAS
jgi:ribosomal protein L7/L12